MDRLRYGQNFGSMGQTVAGGDLLVNICEHQPRTRVPQHEHAEPYLCVILSGGFELMTDTVSACVAGSMVAYPASRVHANQFGEMAATCLNIHFGPSWLDDRATSAWFDEYRQRSLGPLARCAAKIIREMRSHDSAAPLAIASAAVELLAESMREPPRARGAGWLSRVVDMIEADPAAAPTLGALAVEAGIHPSHLARVFRREFGETLGDFVRRRRVEQADRALSSPLPLAAIAAGAGFADQAHFTRVYRSHFGVTPGQRRREMRRGF